MLLFYLEDFSCVFIGQNCSDWVHRQMKQVQRRPGRTYCINRMRASPARGVQDTPASSLWPQLCSPQELFGHCSIESSFPVQRTSSNMIGPDPSPKYALFHALAMPLDKQKKTGILDYTALVGCPENHIFKSALIKWLHISALLYLLPFFISSALHMFQKLLHIICYSPSFPSPVLELRFPEQQWYWN